MTNKIGIYDHNKGKQIEREMNADEQAQRQAEISAWLEENAQINANAEAIRLTKISAYEKLGLTETEIEALLPMPIAPRTT
jgi:hypothetical protein